MGATVSVTNQSDVPVNIAVKQVGVLYWKNYVLPGETVCWDLGRVWVTIEAIVDNELDGRTRYRELDRILPIALATGGVLAVAGGAVVAAGPVLLGSGAAAAVALGGATVAAETAGAAATAAAAEAIVSTSAATAAGAAAGAAGGAFAREVAGIFGRKAVGTAADIAADATIGAAYKQYKKEGPMPQVVKARKYGVFAGSNPKLVVKGHGRLITIEYADEQPS